VLGAVADWDDQTELLAAVVDRLGQTNYLLHRAHFKGGEPPKPVPRPGVDPPEETDGGLGGGGLPATLEEAAAFFRTARQE
jgi:hypothetical protein